MQHNLPNLPWGLSEKTVKALLGVDQNATISIIEPAQLFGGYTGEKTLINVASSDAPPTQVLIKRVSKQDVHQEWRAYQALTEVGAPIVSCYGLHNLPDEHAVLAVEYLTDTIAWPISAERHLAWATAAAQLARCPIPRTIELPQIKFFPMHDQLLSGLETITKIPNPHYQTALKNFNPHRLLSIAQKSLSGFLAEIDAMPQGLTHGECYPMHFGRRTPDSPVIFFDITSAGIRPRFFDVHGLIVDHGEPYEIGDPAPVSRRFYETYQPDISYEDFLWEVKCLEGLIALRNITVQIEFLNQGKGEAWQNEEEAIQGHIKWIRLSTHKANEVLTEWHQRR